MQKVDFFTPKSDDAFSNSNTFIDYDRIMEVVSNGNLSNYTFKLGIENAPDNEFYNLIIHKKANGKIVKPYVIKYTVEPEAMLEFEAHNRDIRYFRGYKTLYKFDNFFKNYASKSTDEDCPYNLSYNFGSLGVPSGTYGPGSTIIAQGSSTEYDLNVNTGLFYSPDYSFLLGLHNETSGSNGTAEPATAITVTTVGVQELDVSNAQVGTITIPASWLSTEGNSNTPPQVSVNIRMTDGGCAVIDIQIVTSSTVIEFSYGGCSNNSIQADEVFDDKSANYNDDDCPDIIGEIGLLPHPWQGCQPGYTYSESESRCFKSPCNKLNELGSNTIFKNQMKLITTEARGSNAKKYEQGFKIRKHPDTGEAIQGPIFNSGQNCNQVNFRNLDKYTFGVAHSHPTNCNTYGMFSAGDILMLARMAKIYNNGDHNAFNEFTVVMAYNGGVYAIKFDNETTMNNLIEIHDDLEKRKSFERKIESTYNSLSKLGNVVDERKLAKALLQFFDQRELGISLFKATKDENDSINGWQKQKYNTSNFLVESEPCN